MHDLDIVKETISKECKEDFVGLWSVVWEVKNSLNISDDAEVRDISLQVIKELLNSRDIVACEPGNDGVFIPWSLNSEETFNSILSEWDSLGRAPVIGEIAWFTSSARAKGKVMNVFVVMKRDMYNAGHEILDVFEDKSKADKVIEEIKAETDGWKEVGENQWENSGYQWYLQIQEKEVK